MNSAARRMEVLNFMNQTLPKHITKILWMGVFLVALIAAFFCYSWINIQPCIQQSNSMSVLITTYINGQAAEISSYHFTSDDSGYHEISNLLSSTAYRRQMNQTAKSHDAANQNNLVCLAIQYDADEDVQLCMELWSDGVFFINESSVDLWLSSTTKKDLFEKIFETVIS